MDPERCYKEALQLDPEDGSALCSLARLYLMNDDLDKCQYTCMTLLRYIWTHRQYILIDENMESYFVNITSSLEIAATSGFFCVPLCVLGYIKIDLFWKTTHCTKVLSQVNELFIKKDRFYYVKKLN